MTTQIQHFLQARGIQLNPDQLFTLYTEYVTNIDPLAGTVDGYESDDDSDMDNSDNDEDRDAVSALATQILDQVKGGTSQERVNLFDDLDALLYTHWSDLYSEVQAYLQSQQLLTDFSGMNVHDENWFPN